MSMHLQTEAKKKTVIENHGQEKWESMIEQLNDPDKILWTYSHILPNFLISHLTVCILSLHKLTVIFTATQKQEFFYSYLSFLLKLMICYDTGTTGTIQ